jgi:hypothetical protein
MTNMSLTKWLLLYEIFIFLVAFVKILFLLIWALGDEMSILVAIVAHSLLHWLLSSISLVRSSLLYQLVELLDE